MPAPAAQLVGSSATKLLQAKALDPIKQTAATLASLSKTEAETLLVDLIESRSFNAFQLGGVLALIQASHWYSDGEVTSFRQYVEEKYGVKYRKAMYLIAIYEGLTEAQIEWSAVEHLGWSKLAIIAPVLIHGNVDWWVETAAGMTVRQLQEYVQSHEWETLPQDPPEAPAVSTLTFKVYGEQRESIEAAVQKRMQLAGTEEKAEALALICAEYLSGANGGSHDWLAAVKKVGLHEALTKLSELYPDAEITVEL